MGDIFFGLLLAACSGSDDDTGPTKDDPSSTEEVTGDTGDPDCTGEASVELGTGQLTYETLADGQTLPFYRGPQGGYHVFVSVRAQGIDGGANALDPNNPVLTLRLSSESGSIAELANQPRQLPENGDYVELVGQLLIFSVADPLSYDGTDATLDWSLTDRCVRSFEGSVDVHLVYDTYQTG